jgi:predicted RNA-binding Zn-ribbon protein involved in translation (DUF1610 family)
MSEETPDVLSDHVEDAPTDQTQDPSPAAGTLEIRECEVCHRPTAVASCPYCGHTK